MADEDQFPPTEEFGEATRNLAQSKAVPQSVTGFRLLNKLGEGGMGEVFVAEQLEPVKRKVAIKLIKRGMESKEVLARFDSERQALALMNHSNIAQVFDAGITDDGRPYFVMEFVQGVPVTQYCDSNRMTTKDRLKLFIQICHGVQHSHQKGVIHRDIKPSNVLVKIQDSKPVPKIIDFGVAKATAQRLTEQTLFTEMGGFIGTPEYMSPEQAEMTGLDIDTRTDVYSLGVILYELLVGAQPFDTKELRRSSFIEMRRKIIEEEPPRPSTRISGLGGESTSVAKNRRSDPLTLERQLKGDLDWIVMKALEKDRTRRYDSPGDLAADICRHLRDEPVLAGPPSSLYRVKKFVRRHTLGVTVSALLVCVLVFGIIGTSMGMIRAREAERAAAREAETAHQVSAFLVDLFEVSDPSEALGETITARDMLDKGAEKIEKELSDQPEVQATLMDTIGGVYHNLSLYDKAIELRQKALEISMGVYGGKHRRYAEALNNLALSHSEKGEYEKAGPLYAESLLIMDSIPEQDDPLRATILHNTAIMHQDQGRYDSADSLYRSALEMQRRLFGNNHIEVALTLGDLGILHSLKHDLDESEKCLKEALSIHKNKFGDVHPYIANTLNTLAGVKEKKGENKEAELLYRESLRLNKKMYPNGSRAVTSNLNNLAELLRERGDYEESEKLHHESLDMRKTIYGEEHPKVATTLNNLGLLYVNKGNDDKAKIFFQQALKMSVKFLGEEHPHVANTLYSLSVIHIREKEYLKAEEMLNKILVMDRKLLGPDHPYVASDLYSLADVYLEMKQFREAEELLLDCLGIREKQLPPDHKDIYKTKQKLGTCWLKLERFGDAEKNLLESYKYFNENLGPKNKVTQESRNTLLELYDIWDKPEKAAEFESIQK